MNYPVFVVHIYFSAIYKVIPAIYSIALFLKIFLYYFTSTLKKGNEVKINIPKNNDDSLRLLMPVSRQKFSDILKAMFYLLNGQIASTGF